MFYDRLKKACAMVGTTPSALANEVGITTANTGSWNRGGYPKVANLIKMAKTLGVSTDYLLELDDNTEPRYESPDVTQLVRDYNSMNTQGKEYIRQTMEMTVGKYKKDTVIPEMEVANEIAPATEYTNTQSIGNSG